MIGLILVSTIIASLIGYNSVDKFVGDAPQFDDLTMLCFERK